MTDPQQEEALEIARRVVAINGRLAEQVAAILRILAKDTLRLAALAVPDDAAEVVLVRGCRERAERILAGLGDDERVN